MKRTLISLVLVVCMLLSCGMCITARADGLQWQELLETQTVNDSGVNWFSYTTSATVEVPMPYQSRVTKVDMLISYTYGTKPTKVEVAVGNSWVALDVYEIDTGVARIFGEIGNTFFKSIKLRFTRTATSSSTVEILSLRTYALPFVEDPALGSIVISCQDGVLPVTTSEWLYIEADPYDYKLPYNYDITATFSQPWLYDYLTLYGYVEYASINSIQVTYAGASVPFETNLLDVEASEIWTENGYELAQYGTYYFALTIDVSGIDRTAKDKCVVSINGDYCSSPGMGLKIDTFNGGVLVADSTEASSWVRFKSFMTGLFNDLGTKLTPDFSNLGTWISEQTTTLNTALTNLRTSVNTGFSNVSTWITNQTNTLKTQLVGIWQEAEDGFANVGTWITTQTNTLKTAMNTGFTNIGNWFTNQTNTLVDYLLGIWQEAEAGFANVGTWISNQTTALVNQLLYMEEAICDRLNSFQNSVVAYFNSLFDLMETYFGQDDTEAEQFQDDAGNKADELDDLNNQLQEATKPPIGDIQVDIDNYIDSDSAHSYAGALSALTSSNLLVTMMCMVLTIAFVGYILYGKR